MVSVAATLRRHRDLSRDTAGCDGPVNGLFYPDRDRATAFGALYATAVGCATPGKVRRYTLTAFCVP